MLVFGISLRFLTSFPLLVIRFTDRSLHERGTSSVMLIAVHRLTLFESQSSVEKFAICAPTREVPTLGGVDRGKGIPLFCLPACSHPARFGFCQSVQIPRC